MVSATTSAERWAAADFDSFFSPRAMAVIGASDTVGRPTTMNWRFVKRWADAKGVPVYPVNPFKETVDGIETYASVRDIPVPIDVAVVLLGDPGAVTEDLAAKGVKFAVAFAGGFAEQGAAGQERQDELLERFRASGTRLVGPNANPNAFQIFREDIPGKAIALISQSGHQGRPIFQGQEIGIKVSHWAPTGNEADIESADYISYFSDLPGTGVVAAYIEGFKNGRTLMRAADHAAGNGVPIVMIKVGRTDTGQSWAKSHTGHLAGRDEIVSAVMRQYGITRVDDLDQLLEISAFLSRTTAPRTKGVCVYSISGGTSGHMADILGMAGVPVPELTKETQEQLHQWIPTDLRVTNPIDNGGHPVGDWRGRKILDAIVADPNIGVLVVPIAGAFPPLSDRLVADLIDVSKTTDKPICVVWGSPVGTEEVYRDVLLKSSVPTFRTLRNCASALRAYFDYHDFLQRYRSPFGDEGSAPSERAAETVRALSAAALSETESKELVRRYGIRTTRDILCTSAEEAMAAAESLGYPVVLKAASRAIAHKSDLGLVKVGVPDSNAVRTHFEELMRIAEAAAPGEVDGVLVCEQVSGGTEIVIGVINDELFGPTIMFGIGGISVEVYKDVTFRVPPFDIDEAHRMIREIKGLPLLTGARGRPPADLDAIARAIMDLHKLVVDAGDHLAELDLNPLLALPDAVVAVDALVVPSKAVAQDNQQ